MFELITNHLSKYVNPMIVLKIAVLSSVLAGILGVGFAVTGNAVVGGMAIIATAIPVGVLTAFEVLYLSHEG